MYVQYKNEYLVFIPVARNEKGWTTFVGKYVSDLIKYILYICTPHAFSCYTRYS